MDMFMKQKHLRFRDNNHNKEIMKKKTGLEIRTNVRYFLTFAAVWFASMGLVRAEE